MKIFTENGVLITLICVTGMLISTTKINGQTRKELEERKAKTQQEIEYTNKLLLETQKNRKNTIQKVKILNTRIKLRNEIIENINQEINSIEREIEQKNALISGMEKDLEKVKEQYKELIVKAYWNKNKQDWLMFIMSSENFNQAYRRMKYIQKFAGHRKEQAEQIQRMKTNIIEEVEKLESIKDQKEALILEKRNENHNMEIEKRGKNRMVTELMNKEKELHEEMKRKREIADKLEKEIAKIIAEEARKARSRNIYDQLTPEEKLISDNFKGNKGNLPWPVERGVITGTYGVHPHPVLKQITVENDGIDISTVKGAEARAMFDGEVTKIVAILGANYTVILRHGNFLTVYQNLVDLKVKQGEKVRLKQPLGTVFTDMESNSTVMQLQIWKERNIQNPEEWISRN